MSATPTPGRGLDPDHEYTGGGFENLLPPFDALDKNASRSLLGVIKETSGGNYGDK